jgi:hypothetical protein
MCMVVPTVQFVRNKDKERESNALDLIGWCFLTIDNWQKLVEPVMDALEFSDFDPIRIRIRSYVCYDKVSILML